MLEVNDNLHKTGESPRVVDDAEAAKRDFELSQRAAVGDELARRQILTRLYSRVRTTVYYLAYGRTSAEDFVQMSMVEILLSLGSYRALSSLESWADRIVVRTTMRQLRSARREAPTVSMDAVQLPHVASEAENDIYSRQLNHRIATHMANLNPKHAEALTLHLVLGYTIREVAEMTNTKQNTVRDRLKVARKKFRKMVERDSVLAKWACKE